MERPSRGFREGLRRELQAWRNEGIVTEQAVFRLRGGSLVLTELLGEATVADVSSVTEARFTIELED